MPMTKSETAAALAEKVGITKKQVGEFFQAQAELAYKQAKNAFVIPGIGKLVVKNKPPRPARMGRNPATGEPMQIKAKPASKVLKFRMAKAAKDAILGAKK
jgi:DNA-binding protein HU-beta